MKIDVIDNKNLRITVMEGKKNEIRIVLGAIGAPVKKLHRISFGNIELGDLAPGKIRAINQKTIDLILKSF
jgi:23S rRNA pseudouridine2605 synthase